ncbi:MAG: histidinol-phosphatase [Alphaproteobacteria bacterium]|nr:histidinol-phosphatase [Alphaproteobacteria bacterium]
MQQFLKLANRLADKSGEIIKSYFRQSFEVKIKKDLSPVTEADRKVEEVLRAMIEAECPDHGIIGEEFGEKESKSDLTWVLDPIDGTKSFVMGRPTFGTLIALCQDNTPLLGIIDQPILQERWVGLDKQQTTMNGKPVSTRPCTSLEDAVIASTTPNMFDNSEYGKAYTIFNNGETLAWGGDCYMYGLIASGYMDIAFECNLKPYDFAALVPVITGAGGHISNWRGDPLTLKSTGEVIAVGDKNLWPEIDRLIRKSPF